jgi:hypothetical protein
MITPRRAWILCAFAMGAWFVAHFPKLMGWTPRLWILESTIKLSFLGAAALLAFLLNLQIAAEHRQSFWMRWAWLALAGNAAISFVRTLIESPFLHLYWISLKDKPTFGLAQHLAIVPANACLLLGLLAIGWSYTRVGLGFRIEKQDFIAVIGVLGLMIALLYFRAGLTEARSPYASGRWLQLIGLVLLSLSAAAGLVLHRMAMQMGGGKLALALRCLTFYTLLRAVLVLLQAWRRSVLPEGPILNEFLSLFLEQAWQFAPWLALLAAAYRAELTTHAARELAQYRAAKAALASA